MHSSSVAPSRAYLRLFITVSVKRNASCSTTPICWRRLSCVSVGDVLPVDHDRARVDVVIARQHVDDRALARARRPAEADLLARLRLEGVVLEDRAALHIAEVDVVELDMAALKLERLGVGARRAPSASRP